MYYNEQTIKAQAEIYAKDRGVDYTYAIVLVETINHFLSLNNKNITYSVNYSSDLSNDDAYALLLLMECGSGYPTIFNGNFKSNSYVPYSTTGHYVLSTGLKNPTNSTNYTAIISDPYNASGKNYSGIWEMPLSALRTTNKAHSSGGVYIAAELSFRR